MTKKLCIILIPLFLLACSKKGAEKADVSIKIVSGATSNLSTSDTGIVGTFGNATPNTIDGFNCFGVFINYTDSAPPGVCRDVNDVIVSSPHQAFGTINLGTELTGEVRISDQVVFEAFALYSSSGKCPQSGTDLADMKADLSPPVILGETIQSVDSGTSTISITASLDGNQQTLKTCSSTKMAFRPPKVCDPNENPNADSTTDFAAGAGTAADPYIICTEDQLMLVDSTTPGILSEYYELGTDISLSSAWTPIARGSGELFSGSFNGKGRVISNISIGTLGDHGTGFFGNVGAGATISNLKLQNVNYTQNTSTVGGIVGFMKDPSTRVFNVSASGSIQGNNSLGGIVGKLHGGKIYNVRNRVNIAKHPSASVTSTSGVYSHGGIVGKFSAYSNTQIFNAANYGSLNVEAGNRIGGIAGNVAISSFASPTPSVVSIKDSFNKGLIQGRNYIGGITGASWSGDIDNAFNTGAIKGVDSTSSVSKLGGISGYFNNSTNQINNTFTAGQVGGLPSSLGTTNYFGHVVGLMDGTPSSNLGSNNRHYYKSNAFPSSYDRPSTCATGSATISCTQNASSGDFKGTTVQSYMTAWDWASIWKTQDSAYPTLRTLP